MAEGADAYLEDFFSWWSGDGSAASGLACSVFFAEADLVEEVFIVVGCSWDLVAAASFRVLVGADVFRLG